MASFTDNQPIQFNPYIQQIPVDDYIRAGMMKQNQYDQGVQRVQGLIDNVAGLPVIGEANKQVLTQRIGELRDRIQGMVGADFSKMNTQMQVTGLASQISRDPVIMASVSSARQIDALDKSIAEARKSGKGYSTANEEYARSYVQDYISASNKEAGLTYQGPTSIHNVTADDVHKKIKEAIAPLKGMEDVDFQVSQDGGVMLLSKDKILDGTRIKAAIEANLTADDRKALSIDGWYNTRGLSDQQLVKRASDQYAQYANHANEMANTYDNMILSSTNMSPADKYKYGNIAQQHREYAKAYEDLMKQTVASLKNGTFNREDIAGNMWTQMTENTYAGAYQFHQDDREYKESPYFDAEMKRANLALREKEVGIQELKALMDKQEKDGLGSSLPIGATIPVTVNPDDPKYQQRYSTQGVQDQVAQAAEALSSGGKAEEIALKAFANNLKNTSDPDAQDLSGLNADGTWKSATDRERVKKMAAESTAMYTAASMKPEFQGALPGNAAFRNAHLNNLVLANVADLTATADKNVTDQALRGDKKLNIASPSTVVTVKDKKGNDVKLTLGAIARIAQEGVDFPNISDKPLPTSTYGGFGVQTQSEHSVKEGSELANYDKASIFKALEDKGVALTKLKNAKDIIYKSWDKVVNPRMRPLPASDKVRNSQEYDLYRTAVLESDIFNNGSDKDGNKITPEMKPLDRKDINIDGAFVDTDGRVKVKATWKYKEGKAEKTTSAYVDVDEMRNSLGSTPAGQNSFLYSRFFSDDRPELTASLILPGSSGTTAFSEKNGFIGSMFIANNDNVARKYGIAFDKQTGNFKVTIAIPVGNGKFHKIDLDPRGFPNAGAAIKAAEATYSPVQGNIKLRDFEYERFLKPLGLPK